MMMDGSKSYTFDYVKRHLKKIPSHIDVLVVVGTSEAPGLLTRERSIFETALMTLLPLLGK